MKTFIFTSCFFVLMLAGIVYYQIKLTHKTDNIIMLTNEIESYILIENKKKTQELVENLGKKFTEMQNWIMAFEDHEQILKMSQCIESMKVYSKNYDESELLNELYNFKFLLNYSVKSVMPTIENIL